MIKLRDVNFLSVSLTTMGLCFFAMLIFVAFISFGNVGYEAGVMTCRQHVLEQRR